MRLRTATWGLRATRTRENAAVVRRWARAPRPWGARRLTRCLTCRQGTPRCGQFPHRAPTGALPPCFEGGEKGSVPGALRVAHHRPGRRSVGFFRQRQPG